MPERRFRRIAFEAEAEICANSRSWTGDLLDIAMKGALVATSGELPLALGQECSLSITLPGTPVALDFRAELVHREQNQYGFKFVSENLETMTHLRKLIELNTGDSETTREELARWLKD